MHVFMDVLHLCMQVLHDKYMCVWACCHVYMSGSAPMACSILDILKYLNTFKSESSKISYLIFYVSFFSSREQHRYMDIQQIQPKAPEQLLNGPSGGIVSNVTKEL